MAFEHRRQRVEHHVGVVPIVDAAEVQDRCVGVDARQDLGCGCGGAAGARSGVPNGSSTIRPAKVGSVVERHRVDPTEGGQPPEIVEPLFLGRTQKEISPRHLQAPGGVIGAIRFQTRDPGGSACSPPETGRRDRPPPAGRRAGTDSGCRGGRASSTQSWPSACSPSSSGTACTTSSRSWSDSASPGSLGIGQRHVVTGLGEDPRQGRETGADTRRDGPRSAPDR